MKSGKQIIGYIMAAIGGLATVGAGVAAATGNWATVQTFLEIIQATL